MGATDQGVGKRRSGRMNLHKNLCCGGPGSFSVCFGDVGDDTMHWEGFEKISLQNRPQADKKATAEGD